MKKPKKFHLGSSLQDIIEKQDETDIYLPNKIIEETELEDIMTGEKLADWHTEKSSYTLVEDIDEAVKQINKKKGSSKSSFNKSTEIIKEKSFQSFKFIEKEDRFELIIDKEEGKSAKEILESAFLDIITQVSDVDQFIS